MRGAPIDSTVEMMKQMRIGKKYSGAKPIEKPSAVAMPFHRKVTGEFDDVRYENIPVTSCCLYRHWNSGGFPSPLEYSSSQPGDIEPQMHVPSSFEMPRQIGSSSIPEAIA